ASERAALAALGVVIEREDPQRSLVQASVPARALAALAARDYVAAVTEPEYGVAHTGSRNTQGDAILSFNSLRSRFFVNGSGVTVGVISDGIAGLATAIASGDLPATTFNRDGTGKLTSTTGGVIAQSFRADGDLEAGLGGGVGAEGTAMLEIIHDIAPGAQLRFANFSTDLEFNAAVDFLAANSDVVLDDIGWFAKTIDQTSNVSQNLAAELTRASNRIRGYYTAVGNSADKAYSGLFVNSGTDGLAFTTLPGALHRFQASATTTDALGLGPSFGNRITLAPGATVTARLTWDDPEGAVANDYDLFLLPDPPGPFVAFGANDNLITRLAFEFLAFTNTAGVTRSFNIVVQNFANLSAAKTLRLFVDETVRTRFPANNALLNFNTTAGSLTAAADAGGGVVAVGAISAADPGNDDIELFSSRGPTANGVMKPDVTAIDGVDVTGSAGFPSPFFGTSAAAPHVAAFAALLLSLRTDLMAGEPGDNPAADRTALRNAIVNTAVDLGAAGPDNTFGAGRVHGVNAAASIALAPTLANVSPNTGPATGGTTVTVTGTRFQQGATAVIGRPLANVNVPGATTLSGVTLSNGAGASDVVVTNPDGQSVTIVNGFTFLAAPTVTNVNPNTGPAAGGTDVTITGTGFLSNAAVTFGGTAATNVVVANATTITARTPAHAAGAVNVTVTNPDAQTGTLNNGFTYAVASAPTVTNVNPNQGLPTGGTDVTITGTGFQAGATPIIGRPLANVTVVNSTTITGVTRSNGLGVADVVVTNPDGQTGTLANG
ncbi:MAG: hypothetical protein FJ315_04905, partial [SAR202 cluster bacterium]|nr:hypothetical protein [SAR202 cluster bacterium]